jgi:hypothetical protein
MKEISPMKKAIALVAIAFALVVGATVVVTVSPQQAFACDGNHRGV